MTKAATFQNPIFQDEDKAREALEAVRWPDGPVCPHCGNSDPEKIAKVEGEKRSHRRGLYYCNECKGQFTVTVGTVFERSKVPLTKWWMAAHMLNSGKNGVSAHEIHRTIGVTYKTAWFMMHRLREAMIDGNPTPMGGEGKTVQCDETYYGNTSKRAKHYRKGHSHKASVVALVEPHGRVRAVHLQRATADSVRELLVTNVHRTTELHTDESQLYTKVGKEFFAHKTVEHGWNQRGFMSAKTVRQPTQSKTFSACSSAASKALTSFAQNNTCNGIWRSSRSDTIIAPASGLPMENGRSLLLRVSRVSA